MENHVIKKVSDAASNFKFDLQHFAVLNVTNDMELNLQIADKFDILYYLL